MDISEIKARVLILREKLLSEGIHFDGAILFGSRATGNHREDSDIDLAIISRNYGYDRSTESIQLNKLAFQCIPYCDAVPIGIKEYIDPQPLSPILHEIKKNGTPLF